MSERKAGWYMTQYRAADAWVPVRWCAGCGWETFERNFEPEGYFHAVGPRIPTPDEMKGWQLVPIDADETMVRAGMNRGASFGFGAHYAAALRSAPRFGDDHD